MDEPETVEYRGADGIRLVADVSGPSGGRPILLAHGTGQSRHSWRATIEALGARGFRAIAYDLRGHGDSDRAADYQPAAHAADMRAILAEIAAPAVLIGASLGGIAALQLLGRRDPPPALALVLIDIGHRFDAAGTEKVGEFMRGTTGGFDSLDDASAAIAAYLPHRAPRKPGGGLLRTLVLRDDGRYYWRWDPAMVQSARPTLDMDAFQRHIEACLGRVTVPTLVIRGTNSEILTRETADEMMALLAHGTLAEVPGAHHMVAGDDNNAFMTALLAFIDTLAPEPASVGGLAHP